MLRVSFVGFKPVQRNLDLTQTQTIDIPLETANYVMDDVVVQATRATSGSGATYRNVSKEELEKNNLGQDLPYLLNQTPSVVVTSDAGAGVGYTGIRIRGSDPTRVNVTINGIPYNDTESQGTFFVDIPDFASSVDNIQVQRGVGTSTNGAGAFGGSLNIQTNTRRDEPYAELNNTFGSYDTWKNTVLVGSGLINDRFTFDGRLSRVSSDGYIDRAASSLRSYFLSGAFYGKKDLVRANVFAGSERTYQAWNGVPEAELENNRTYNGFTYEDQTDNYTQDHYQLLWAHTFDPKLTLNTALHYTHGRGYYEEFREDNALANYGIASFVVGATTFDRSDLVRRRWLDNDFYGATWSLIYRPENRLNLTLGGAWNKYDGAHFGEVIWAQYASNSSIHQHYYDGTGVKTDFNIFGKAVANLGKLTVSADLQYRRTGYRLAGTDKNRNPLNQEANLDFFNPKVGLNYELARGSELYASFAVANKEPNRDDFINSTAANRPRPENLKDVEAGYRYSDGTFQLGVNGFGMFYRNQLILTGKINDVGEYIRQNVADSYRIGAELDGRIALSPALSWAATASLSRNRVKDFVSYDDDYDNGGQLVTNFEKTSLAFSPAFVGSSELSWLPAKKLEVALLSKYVGRQFLDNTSNSSRQLDAFFVNDLRFRLSLPARAVKNIGITLLVNNVFNELYEANGYTFSYLYGGAYTTENYYFPQAERNFLLGLSLKF